MSNRELERLVYRIVSEGINRDVLDDIASYFRVDACSIVVIKDFNLTLVEESSFFESNGINVERLYKETQNENLLLYDAIKKGLLVVNDYQNYRRSHSVWKKAGLKSVFLFKIESEFNAVIGLESFSTPREFSEKDIKDIAFLSKFISQPLENKLFRDVFLSKISKLGVSIPSCEALDCIREWVRDNLRNIIGITNSKIASLVYPSGSLYAFVEESGKSDFVKFKKTTETKNMISYMMFKSGLKGPAVFRYDFLKGKVVCFDDIKKKMGVKNILVIPIWEKDTLVATVGYGYVHDYVFSVYDVNLITVLTKELIGFIKKIREFNKIKGILSKNEEEIIHSFIATIEMKDVYTKGHSQRVAFYAKKIAEEIGLPKKQVDRIYIAGLLHDVGKVSLPDAVLFKPSTLSEIEYEIIKYHPILSYEVVGQFRSLPDLKSIAEMVRHHHERCDGSGYPDGLECDRISKGAKILAVADVFDALTTSRPYRKAFSVDEAIQIMFSEKWHFDWNILNKSVSILKRSYVHATKISERSFVPKVFDEYKYRFRDIDYLTGLLKRDVFLKNVESLIDLRDTFVAFLVDVKDMDYINLTYSPVFGDELLIAVSKSLYKLYDYGALFLSRFGGDSFVFVLPYSKKVDNRKKVIDFLGRLSNEVCKVMRKKVDGFKVEFSISKVYSYEIKTPIELIYLLRKRKRKKFS